MSEKSLSHADELEIGCEYENIRKWLNLPFMEQEPRQMDKVKVGESIRGEFAQCRLVALKLGEELGKAYLPGI